MVFYNIIRQNISFSLFLGTCEWRENINPTWCSSSLRGNTRHVLDNHVLNQLFCGELVILFIILGDFALANGHKLDDVLVLFSYSLSAVLFSLIFL